MKHKPYLEGCSEDAELYKGHLDGGKRKIPSKKLVVSIIRTLPN